MKKVFLLIFILIAGAAVYFLKSGSLLNSCTYPDWVKENNNILTMDMTLPENKNEEMCRLPVTLCKGSACMAPLLGIDCGGEKIVCGQTIKCVCKI